MFSAPGRGVAAGMRPAILGAILEACCAWLSGRLAPSATVGLLSIGAVLDSALGVADGKLGTTDTAFLESCMVAAEDAAATRTTVLNRFGLFLPMRTAYAGLLVEVQSSMAVSPLALRTSARAPRRMRILAHSLASNWAATGRR